MKFNYNAAGWMVVVGLLGAMVPTNGRAAETDDELLFEARSLVMYAPSDSVDALSDDGVLNGLSLGFGFDLSNYVVSGLRGYLLFDGAGETRSRFDKTISFDWERQVYMLGADYGPDLWGFFRPSVRVGAGYSTQKLSADVGRQNSTHYTDRTHDLVVSGAVGLELYIPYSDDTSSVLNRLTVGLGGNVGYMAQTAAEFDELKAADDSWQSVPMDFGELNVDGIYWNLGLTMRIKI